MKPADLKGLTIRTPPDPMTIDFLQSLDPVNGEMSAIAHQPTPQAIMLKQWPDQLATRAPAQNASASPG